MKKIISLFQRNYDGDRLVRNEVVPGAEWVLTGEGSATRKFNGTCCMVRDGKLYKRYGVKQIGSRPLPIDFEPVNEVDEVTGKQQGWVPVGDGPEDHWHREAWTNQMAYIHHLNGTTWELCGPKVQGNPERAYTESEVGPNMHLLIPHGRFILADCPHDFDGLKVYLTQHDIEGIVWWRNLSDQDCDKVKIKGRDFGSKRGRQ